MMNDPNEMSEGEYLSNLLDDGEEYRDRDAELAIMKDRYTSRYVINKAAKVRTKCICPVCKKEFAKKSYQQAFCRTKCKDRYWNTVDDGRRERAVLFNL